MSPWRPDPDALESHVRAICGTGNRFVGSAGESACRDLIYAQFGRLDLENYRQEEFEVVGYQPLGSECEIVGVDFPVPTAGLQFSVAGEVTAPAVSLGAARSISDIGMLEERGVDLAGRIAVIDTDQPIFLGAYLRNRGCAGVVNISLNPYGHIGHFTAHNSALGGLVDVPGVIVERRAGSALLALVVAGHRVLRIRHDATYHPVASANVVAEVPGFEFPDQRVVVGAHYDTQLEGVGAQDNATGVATLIEMARACHAQPCRRTVVFVAFGDEEHGLKGSTSFCQQNADTLADTVAMVCLDALAWKYPSKRSLRADASIQSYARQRCREVGWEPEEVLDASQLWDSDHNSFIEAGVPAAWIWHSDPQHPGYHSVDDTIDLLDFDRVADTAAVIGHLAFSLADDPDLALGRSQPTKLWLPEAVPAA